MNLPLFPSSRHWRMLILAAVSLLAMTAPRHPVAMAADNFWVGGASNGNFTDNANWSSPPSWGFGNSLKFNANTNATSLTNDYGSWVDNNDIFWDPTFPVARTLQSTGNGINFKIRVENQSSFPQTVTMPLSGGKDGAGGIQLNPVAGSLTLSGPIYNDNSVDYAVFGSQTATVTNLTLNTALGPNAPTQTNVDFVVAGGRNTAVEVNASQVWAGTTDVQSGSFTTANGVTLASTAIIVGGGTVATTSANTLTDTASLTVNTGRLSIGGSDTVASLSGTGGSVDVASGATLTFGGSGSTSYAGSIMGAGNLTKVGSGTFTLPSASSLTGTMTVAAGSVVVTNTMANSAVNVSGGSLQLIAANLLADTAAITLSGGTLAFAAGDTIGSLAGIGGTVDLGGTITHLYVQQNVNTTFAGTMSGSLAVLHTTGTGRLTLSGTSGLYNVLAQAASGGTVVVDGLATRVGVSTSCTLAGTGTVTADGRINGGIHAPGPGGGGPGVQTFQGVNAVSGAALSYQNNAVVNWDLIANTTAGAGTNYDHIVVSAGNLLYLDGTTLNLSFDGVGSLVDWSNAFWDVNRAWRVWDLGAGVTGGVGNLSVGGSLLDSLGNTLSPTTRGSFSISQDGQDVMLNFVAVPEPSTVGIALSGLGLATALRYRRRRARDS